MDEVHGRVQLHKNQVLGAREKMERTRRITQRLEVKMFLMIFMNRQNYVMWFHIMFHRPQLRLKILQWRQCEDL